MIPRLLYRLFYRNVEIEETTVGNLFGMSCGVANIRERTYEDHRGREHYGLTANLSIWDRDIDSDEEVMDFDVGRGTRVRLGPAGIWKVTDVRDGEHGDNGSVCLRRLFFGVF